MNFSRSTSSSDTTSLLERRRRRNYNYHELPNWMKDNDLVLTGYRPPTPSCWPCVQTLFSLHNETISIWSHLLAAIYFSYRSTCNYKCHNCPTPIEDDLFLRLYHATAAFAFIASAIYHLFCCHSHHVRDTLVKLDYIGITVFITGSFMTWVYYAFYSETSKTSVYLYAICFGGFLVAIITQLEHFNNRDGRMQRAGVYIVFGISLSLPSLLLFQHSWDSPRKGSIINSMLYTASIYVMGGIIYSTRLPEKFWPGQFDIIGHSHQIFHVVVVIAAKVHEKMIIFIAVCSINCQNGKC